MKHPGSILLVLLFGSSGCYYDIEQDLYPNTFCDMANVTWTTTIEPLVQSRCAIPECHVPGETDPDLSTYSGVKENADNGLIRTVVVQDKTMPNNGTLTDCQIQQIELWLSAGAAQN